ncbi:MAG: DUF460 domain-containing protein [Candidatus Nanohaloarchaea archaeon]
MNDKPLIVGVDPGSTSAVVALDLEGEKVLQESRREFSRHEIIEEIINAGFPLLIACDREEMPSNVEKIATSLGAEKFEPENDLSRSRKNRLGEGENLHEKDAHASALHAFKQVRKTIRKIEKDSSRKSVEKREVAREYFR